MQGVPYHQSIKVFPSLVSKNHRDEVFVEEISIGEVCQSAQERTKRKSLATFRPANEVVPLSSLRDQVRRRHETQMRTDGRIGNKRKVAFRPCNPWQAREALATKPGGLAKNPFTEGIHAEKLRVPRRPARQKSWKPPSGPIRHFDTFLNSDDVETRLKELRAFKKRQRQSKKAFHDTLVVRNAKSRNKHFLSFLQRLENRVEHERAVHSGKSQIFN